MADRNAPGIYDDVMPLPASDGAAEEERNVVDHTDAELPEEMAQLLGEYERHLVNERNLAPHSVRAYLTDVAGMLEHARRLGAGAQKRRAVPLGGRARR